MKTKARRVIEKWVGTNFANPTYIGDGQVFLFPSDSNTHNIVVWVHRQTPKNVFSEFSCSCAGYWYRDNCKHIEDLKNQITTKKLKEARRVFNEIKKTG